MNPTRIITDQQDQLPAEITVYRSNIDNALVIEIDTYETTGHTRIYLNDGTIFDADPDAPDPPA